MQIMQLSWNSPSFCSLNLPGSRFDIPSKSQYKKCCLRLSRFRIFEMLCVPRNSRGPSQIASLASYNENQLRKSRPRVSLSAAFHFSRGMIWEDGGEVSVTIGWWEIVMELDLVELLSSLKFEVCVGIDDLLRFPGVLKAFWSAFGSLCVFRISQLNVD